MYRPYHTVPAYYDGYGGGYGRRRHYDDYDMEDERRHGDRDYRDYRDSSRSEPVTVIVEHCKQRSFGSRAAEHGILPWSSLPDSLQQFLDTPTRSGGRGQRIYENLRHAVHRQYPDVRFREVRGREPNSFEVFINNRLAYSKSKYGGYPREEEILHEISRARRGHHVRPANQNDSCGCTIS